MVWSTNPGAVKAMAFKACSIYTASSSGEK
jgi:hypothetical protein